MKNLLVAQSGGPTAAINATLAGVISQCMIEQEIDRILGGQNGIEGIMAEHIIDLRHSVKNTLDLERLSQTPASALGSCRFKLRDPDEDDSQYRQLLDIFRKYEVTYFIYIGGNDSMDTVDKLSRYCEKRKIHDIKIFGAPKTIDNDLAETDHCPGFGSAAKYIAMTISEIERDISVYRSFGVTIVEIMGRNAGWLTASAALARRNGLRGADFIYLCERPFSKEQFIRDIRSKQAENRNVLVAVSEGLKDLDGQYISGSATGDTADVFGHKNIAGTGRILEQLVRDKLGCKVRSVELNLMQRCAGHITSRIDLQEAQMLGAAAVRSAVAGNSGKMMTIVRKNVMPYGIKFSAVPVELAANREKTVPTDWITANGNYVTKEMLEYLEPLVDLEMNHFVFYNTGYDPAINCRKSVPEQ